MKHLIILLLSLLILVASSSQGAKPTSTEDSARFRIEELARDLDIPWGMAFLSPAKLILTEKHGAVELLDLETGQTTRLAGVPAVEASGQGGMLDVAVPPDYPDTSWIYFTYSKPVQGYGATTLARARLENRGHLDWQDLLVTRSATDADHHYGSRIAFDAAGHVFFTVGDRGERGNGQNLANHAGKVIRLNLDGTVPADNPFVASPGALAEIYSYGHRNPQGLAYDPLKNRLWLIEHGPRGGDEINLIKPGANYGWPVVSHGKEYWGPIPVGEGTEKEGVEPPVKVYDPSIAPGSLLLYSGKAFPAWRGNLLAGALKLQHINRITLDPQGRAMAEERLLGSLGERIRALIEGPEGFLYFSTDSGRIFRMVPQSE